MITSLNAFSFSSHAARRCSQRGLRPDFLSALLRHADVEVPAGGAAMALSVSPSLAQQLNIDDRLSRYAAVVSSDACLITIVPIRRGRQGRVYRRGRR